MNIMFLSWGEVPRLSSVYGGQLVNVAKTIGLDDRVDQVTLVAGMPLIHSGLVREKWNYGKQLTAINNSLGKDNFLRRYLLVPPIGIYPKESQIKLFMLGQMQSMVAILKERQPDILHCRSYLATYMAHEWKRISGLDYKIVFDSRSYMPDEAIKRGRWSEGSSDHKFWRQTEKQLLRDSDAINVVSEPMRTRFIGMGADPDKVHLIHLNVTEPVYQPSENKSASKNLNNQGMLFCYCGYLDYNGWHHPSRIWEIFDQVASLRDDAKLLIITKSSHAMLKADLSTRGYGHLIEKIEFTSAESSTECVRIMQDCDVGLLSYFSPETELEIEMSKGVFATKTAEYLFAGIPVLVSDICGGAADFVKAHKAGFAYNDQEKLNQADIDILLQYKKDQERLITLAKDKFDIMQNANRLISIYETII